MGRLGDTLMQLAEPKFRALLGTVLAIVAFGCGSPKPTAYPTDYKAQFEKKHGGDEPRARTFVSVLAGLPAGERRTYLLQHTAEAKNLALIPDKDLQARYKSLMKPN